MSAEDGKHGMGEQFALTVTTLDPKVLAGRGDLVSPDWVRQLLKEALTRGPGRATERFQLGPFQECRPVAHPAVHLLISLAVEVQSVIAEPGRPGRVGQELLQQWQEWHISFHSSFLEQGLVLPDLIKAVPEHISEGHGLIDDRSQAQNQDRSKP